MDLETKAGRKNAQQVEKVQVSVLIGKNLSLFQAAVDHVVPPAFNVEPQRSGHDQENNLASAERNVKGNFRQFLASPTRHEGYLIPSRPLASTAQKDSGAKH